MVAAKGRDPIAMSTKRKNMETTFNMMDFVLSTMDMARIDDLARRVNHRIVNSAPWVPEWDK